MTSADAAAAHLTGRTTKGVQPMTDQPLDDHDTYDDDDSVRSRRPRPIQTAPEPVRFQRTEERDTSKDHVPFVIEDTIGQPLTEVLQAYRPKQWVIIKMGQVDQSEQVDMFLDEVLDEESAAYLRDRFDDDDDDLDVDDLATAIEGLMGLWYGRPTGRAAASLRSRQPSRSGVRSKGRRR